MLPFWTVTVGKAPARLAPIVLRPRHALGVLSKLHKRQQCTKSVSTEKKTSCQARVAAPTATSLAFWSSRPVWNRAMVNTLRCLVGCTLGDFSAMWYLQTVHPGLGISTIMAISSKYINRAAFFSSFFSLSFLFSKKLIHRAVASGVTTSLLLETTLLRYGRDRLPWPAAVKTAAGMSMISMLTMEMAQNLVDYHLTGGMVQFDSPAFWGAAFVSMGAGLIAPLPYNYLRLRKYGKACH
ncbi:hypothetical protein HJFPF1_13042 [Paramyrothecium foliicola]|nr:hypothetical protein HJFPF1_13042 [Paramyrothecium foliicola]